MISQEIKPPISKPFEQDSHSKLDESEDSFSKPQDESEAKPQDEFEDLNNDIFFKIFDTNLDSVLDLLDNKKIDTDIKKSKLSEKQKNELQEQRIDKLQELSDELSSNFLKQINSISDNEKLKLLKEEIINDKVLTPLHKLILNKKINEKIIVEPTPQPDNSISTDDIKRLFLEEIESITIYNAENYIDQSNLKERIESSELPRRDKLDIQTTLDNKIEKINNNLFTYFDELIDKKFELLILTTLKSMISDSKILPIELKEKLIEKINKRIEQKKEYDIIEEGIGFHIYLRKSF